MTLPDVFKPWELNFCLALPVQLYTCVGLQNHTDVLCNWHNITETLQPTSQYSQFSSELLTQRSNLFSPYPLTPDLPVWPRDSFCFLWHHHVHWDLTLRTTSFKCFCSLPQKWVRLLFQAAIYGSSRWIAHPIWPGLETLTVCLASCIHCPPLSIPGSLHLIVILYIEDLWIHSWLRLYIWILCVYWTGLPGRRPAWDPGFLMIRLNGLRYKNSRHNNGSNEDLQQTSDLWARSEKNVGL